MSKERLGVKDTVSLVLKKADGTIITNEATIPITADYLRKVIEELEGDK
jgi:hypothetical protein